MHYGFITINGSRFTGPRCDKYLIYILYSPIKHTHLAFNNLNTRVKFIINYLTHTFSFCFFAPLHSYQYTDCSQYNNNNNIFIFTHGNTLCITHKTCIKMVQFKC